MHADAMLDKGSVDGQRVWKRVLAAVKEIQREEPQCRPPIRNLGRRCLRVPGKSRHPCRVFGPASN